MNIDKVLVKRKFSLIISDMLRLKPMAKLTIKEYRAEFENEILAERYLERIIGRTIDVNYHSIAGLGNPPPKDYYESFVEMGELGIISIALAEKMAKASGLRNRLAHEYNGIDEKKVFESIKICLEGFARIYASGKQLFKESSALVPWLMSRESSLTVSVPEFTLINKGLKKWGLSLF
ncbi:hypothetical protein COY52_06085 [Candidatus Desantisbacteria bacterium CG_4_10_14_0_8_um_filter_48_22]|uniref:DUF86 domain-containing protein n=1 Tax=Candidatus Desantisbacteria bacterium CG_4_10_14_0_8_um_filter_48_22 TaxID=1974543 RepID=A0A2M7SB54_9BACT|nr:MAG: hypothetical protein AUJ67_06405 [Candidatus Desantisbacteria bacterium CG1_02_49_89]PIV55410.1 MAG: hypothetical protein COS16_07265 [Candidatus Desantisbacteria bacterium CG02_land_8_20_14_3_00_49_13]PIZ16762.1 MAG: hypothetical protein COY52_06085 [Candidatus Desantisbacteria bacterium CG_4_10_14_0_8_um_filter_48_22]